MFLYFCMMIFSGVVILHAEKNIVEQVARTKSPFLVAQSSSVNSSRNGVKEDFGDLLHAVADNSGVLLSVTGKVMMQIGALQRITAEQASLLIQDEKPFSSASTAKLRTAQEELTEHVEALQELSARLEVLAGKITATVRLEEA
jgi:hypothetical protein